MGRLRRRLFGLSLDEVRYDVRGFRGGEDPAVREHVESIGHHFLDGFHGALELDEVDALIARLESVDRSYRGFAYEGAAMSLYLLDRLMPWRRRFEAFLADRGGDHAYMAYVGAGWAMARLPFRVLPALAKMPPMMRWLAIDGYGFHEGFFNWRKTVEGQRQRPRALRGYGHRAFDQGLGRSLWFVDGHDPDRISATIDSFPADRRADLWSGVGLAAVYAGGVDQAAVERLLHGARGFRPQLAQGASFGAEARRRAGNIEPHNDMAARALCGAPAAEAGELAWLAGEALADHADSGPVPVYEIWRRRLQDHFRATEPIHLAAS